MQLDWHFAWRPVAVKCPALLVHLANQKQELPVAAMIVNGSGQHEQSLERTFHRCFIPGFSSFG
jgi:hypothetical protein